MSGSISRALTEADNDHYIELEDVDLSKEITVAGTNPILFGVTPGGRNGKASQIKHTK